MNNKITQEPEQEKLVGMTFNMPKSWHTAFKMRALQEDKTMHELLFTVFEHYKRTSAP